MPHTGFSFWLHHAIFHALHFDAFATPRAMPESEIKMVTPPHPSRHAITDSQLRRGRGFRHFAAYRLYLESRAELAPS